LDDLERRIHISDDLPQTMRCEDCVFCIELDDDATASRTDDVSDMSSALANGNSSSTVSQSANATSRSSEKLIHVSPKTSATRKPSPFATALETPYRKVKGKYSV